LIAPFGAPVVGFREKGAMDMTFRYRITVPSLTTALVAAIQADALGRGHLVQPVADDRHSLDVFICVGQTIEGFFTAFEELKDCCIMMITPCGQ